MVRYRYVSWVFVATLAALLAVPWLLPHHAWADLLSPGFNWPKGVVFLAFAGMAAAYAYWMVQFAQRVRTIVRGTCGNPKPLDRDLLPDASGAPRSIVETGRSLADGHSGCSGRGGANARNRLDERGA